MKQLRKRLHSIINYSQVESVQYTLAKYMIYEYKGAFKLSINKVVQDTLVSKSSILKFCNYLGYDSWKTFSVELQNSCEEEKMHIDSIKIDTGMLYTKKIDLESHKNEYLKVWEEYHQNVNKIVFMKCIEYLDKAKKIVVLGDIVEINMFVELQRILLQYQKELEFPKILHVKNLKEQIDGIDAGTLVILTNSTMHWSLMREHETLQPVFYLNQIRQSGASIIYIGQGDTLGEKDGVFHIVLPFSFNENFIYLLLQEFVYQLGHIYIHTH